MKRHLMLFTLASVLAAAGGWLRAWPLVVGATLALVAGVASLRQSGGHR